MISQKHYQTDDIKQTVEDLNGKWKALCSKTEEKGMKVIKWLSLLKAWVGLLQCMVLLDMVIYYILTLDV